MKKARSIVAACALIATLSGCAQQDSTKDAEQNDQDVSIETEQQTTEADEDEALAEYVANTELADTVNDACDIVGQQITALQNGKYDECSSLCNEAVEKCEEIIDYKDVPKGAEMAHQYLVESAVSLRDASMELSNASIDFGSEQSNRLLDEAIDDVNDFGDSLEKFNTAVADISRQVLKAQDEQSGN